MLFAGLLAGACATGDGAGSPGSGPSGPDTPVSNGNGGTTPTVSAAGRGTAIIAVSDPSGQPLALIPVEVHTIGWPMPSELAIDIARMTDQKGEYLWTHLPPGEYEFIVRVPGGTGMASKRVTMVAEQTTRIEMVLAK